MVVGRRKIKKRRYNLPGSGAGNGGGPSGDGPSGGWSSDDVSTHGGSTGEVDHVVIIPGEGDDPDDDTDEQDDCVVVGGCDASSPVVNLKASAVFYANLDENQQLWWGNHSDQANQIKAYLDNEGDEAFAIEALKSFIKNDNAEVDWDYRVINDLSDAPCLNNIYDALGGSDAFDSRVKNFDADFSVADLMFTTKSDFGTELEDYKDTMAYTAPPYNSNFIKITFNTDSSTDGNILNKPDVFKVVSFMHEVLHADMYRKMLDALIASDPEAEVLDWDTQEEFDAFLNSLENKYFGIFDYYTRFDYGIPSSEDPNEWQHKQMASAYRGVIKQALTDYDPNLTEDQKKALSWVGLNKAHIEAWQLLEPEEKDAINNEIQEILTSNSFSNGCN